MIYNTINNMLIDTIVIGCIYYYSIYSKNSLWNGHYQNSEHHHCCFFSALPDLRFLRKNYRYHTVAHKVSLFSGVLCNHCCRTFPLLWKVRMVCQSNWITYLLVLHCWRVNARFWFMETPFWKVRMADTMVLGGHVDVMDMEHHPACY